MAWLALMSVLTLFGAFGVVANVNRLLWQRHVAHEVRALLAASSCQSPLPASPVLPPVVARYRELALGNRAPCAR